MNEVKPRKSYPGTPFEVFQYYSFVALLWASLGSFLYSAVLFLSQLGYWLFSGKWIPLSGRTLFTPRGASDTFPERLVLRIFDDVTWPWLVEPRSWLGVHKLVMWFIDGTLTLSLIYAGTAFMCLLAWWGNVKDPTRLVFKRGP